MTKYCPSCENEFQDSISTCPEDGMKLFNSPDSSIKRAQLIDFYAASGEVEAELIFGILTERGIASRIFRPHISQLPTLGDGRFVIAAKPEQKEKAAKIVEQAREDGIISSSGLFL